jgi:DNA-binding transcriptional LysR family regulator
MKPGRAPRLSLDLLRGFRAAARHLSFTRAAQELFVTQSAISREIKTLEEQIGQPLFARVHRTLTLTPAGTELYRAADDALTQLDAITDRLRGATSTMTVATTPALASLWLAPRLPAFYRQWPGVDVRIVASNDRPDLDRDRLDIAIRFVNAGDDAPDAEELIACQSFPVCSPVLASDRRCPIKTPVDLAGHVRLDYESVRDGRRFSEWDFWFDAMGIRPVSPAGTLRFPQFDQTIPAVIDGAGIAIGVLPHLNRQLDDGQLCAPFGPEAIARRGTFFIVKRGDLVVTDAVNGFIAWLRGEASRDRERMAVSRNAPRAPPRKGTRRASVRPG